MYLKSFPNNSAQHVWILIVSVFSPKLRAMRMNIASDVGSSYFILHHDLHHDLLVGTDVTQECLFVSTAS